MVILKTRSQLDSFLKRESKHSYSKREGCGCCSASRYVYFDANTNKVLQRNTNEWAGQCDSSLIVIGIYKPSKKRLINVEKIDSMS